MMERKRLAGIEVKDADEGVVVARFAKLGVKDHDADLIEPGAFGDQVVRVSSFNHSSWMGALPVGRGKIREEDDEALADLRFFMDSENAREHFTVIKGLDDLGEWSFGFDVEQERSPNDKEADRGIRRVLQKLTVHEVSPVLKGAGVDTETLAVKGHQLEIPIRFRLIDEKTDDLDGEEKTEGVEVTEDGERKEATEADNRLAAEVLRFHAIQARYHGLEMWR